MKRFMKGCAITALILVVLGMVMGAVAGTVRGRIAIEDTVEAITGGRLQVNFGRLGNWGLTLSEEIFGDIPDSSYYNLEDSMIFNEHYDILRGDVANHSLGSNIPKLDVEIGGCALYLEESPDEDFYLEAYNMKKLQSYVKDNTLHIKAARSGRIWEESMNCEIILYVPKDYHFDKVEMEVGAGLIAMEEINGDEMSFETGMGQITAEYIQASNLSMSAGMGEIVVNEMNVHKLDAETGMGHIYMEGAIVKKADIECSMGGVEILVYGAKKDYNYNVECGMGSTDIGGKSYSGLAREKYIDNGAAADMNVECAMGSVQISFTE